MTASTLQDNWVGDRCQKVKTFSGGWTLDPNSPPEVGQIAFSLLDSDNEIIPDSEGWATPFGVDGAYDLGDIVYRGVFHGVRMLNTGYVFLADRPLYPRKKGVFRVKLRKIFYPNRVRVLPKTAPV